MNTQKDPNELASVENKYFRDLHLALTRLRENKDFQAVILEGYFKKHAVDSVSMLANPAVMREGKRPEIMETLCAISRLEDFFIVIDSLGAEPEDDEDDDEFDIKDTVTV